MLRIIFSPLAILALIQFTLGIALSPPSLAQDWQFQVKPRGTLKAVDLLIPSFSARLNYAEALVTLDVDNNWAPCLARDWRWLDDRTIEFRLREAVRFHNGEKLDAEAIRINWEEYKRIEAPTGFLFLDLPDEMEFETIDEYMVRFTFPEPDGLALAKLRWFFLVAPAFFAEHKFGENHWGFLPEAGPWGTGPFKAVEGSFGWGSPSERLVLEAYEDYWDPRYPKLKRVIFENTLIGDRKEAMRLCRESEGQVDIVSHIRALDTLKVAESPFAKVVKSRDVGILWGAINERKRDSKWRDIRLRKAVNWAINRKELWKYAAKGNAYNLEGYPIPTGIYGHNPNLTPYTYDTTRARSLLAEAGYADGFEVTMIAPERWKVEAQIMKRMLERIGLKTRLEVLTFPEFWRRCYIPMLDKPPEEQDWDISMTDSFHWTGHIASSHLVWATRGSSWRWNEYDPVYEEMWKDMAGTVDPEAQEEKIRQMVQHLYDQAYLAFVYSPLTLYAVNKEVNFLPYKSQNFRLKETSVTDNHWSVRAEQVPDEE